MRRLVEAVAPFRGHAIRAQSHEASDGAVRLYNIRTVVGRKDGNSKRTGSVDRQLIGVWSNKRPPGFPLVSLGKLQ